MAFDLTSYPKVLTLYLELSQYPILAPTLRKLMRKDLFEKGIIAPEAFEKEALASLFQKSFSQISPVFYALISFSFMFYNNWLKYIMCFIHTIF